MEKKFNVVYCARNETHFYCDKVLFNENKEENTIQIIGKKNNETIFESEVMSLDNKHGNCYYLNEKSIWYKIPWFFVDPAFKDCQSDDVYDIIRYDVEEENFSCRKVELDIGPNGDSIILLGKSNDKIIFESEPISLKLENFTQYKTYIEFKVCPNKFYKVPCKILDRNFKKLKTVKYVRDFLTIATKPVSKSNWLPDGFWESWDE